MWWALFGQTLTWALAGVYSFLSGNGVLAAIGAYGLAIMVVTLGVRFVLAPLFHFQLRMSRRSMDQQKKLGPQMAELRKKYKGDPQKQQQAVMELYREHGVNPLASLSGCLPALLQFPILSALYYVFLGNAQQHRFVDHFLFVPHLNETPNHHPLVPGLPIPTLVYLVIPVLAAATTFVQSRMMQQPPSPTATEQEQQQQQMTRTMQVMMPLMIAYFAFVTPAGLGLYWFVSNCVSIAQQYFVAGWGGLRPQTAVAGGSAGRAAASRAAPPKPAGGQYRPPSAPKPSPPNGPRPATDGQGPARPSRRNRRAPRKG